MGIRLMNESFLSSNIPQGGLLSASHVFSFSVFLSLCTGCVYFLKDGLCQVQLVGLVCLPPFFQPKLFLALFLVSDPLKVTVTGFLPR